MQGTTYKVYFGFANRQTYEDFKETDTFKDYFSKDALRHYFGSSSQHSSYFERYLYPIRNIIKGCLLTRFSLTCSSHRQPF